MKRFLLASLAASALVAPSAANAAFLVNYSNNSAISLANDFRAPLTILGQTRQTTMGTILLTSAASITFEYLGSESGLVDRFTAGPVTGTENNTNNFAAPVLLGTASFNAGVFAPFFSRSGSSLLTLPGMDSFGILLGSLTAPAGSFNSNVLYFAFDDLITGADDDYDDFIVRATISTVPNAVPEPTTWAMIMLGFGVVGYSLRSRGVMRPRSIA